VGWPLALPGAYPCGKMVPVSDPLARQRAILHRIAVEEADMTGPVDDSDEGTYGYEVEGLDGERRTTDYEYE
jgi:hypothetical protein